MYPFDHRQVGHARCRLLGVLKRRRYHIGSIVRHKAAVLQVCECLDGLGIAVLEGQGREVEPGLGGKPDGRKTDQPRCHGNPSGYDAAHTEQPSDGAVEPCARAALVRHTDEAERGRQDRQCREAGEDHAAACNHAQIGKSLVVGRHEGQETDGGCDRAHGDGGSHIARGFRQCLRRRHACFDIFLCAQRVVDGEVDAEADEQHSEAGGENIDLPDAEHRPGHGPDAADDQGQEHYRDNAGRAHAEPQHEGEHDEGQGARKPEALPHLLQLVHRQRHIARKADGDAVVLGQAQVGCRVADHLQFAAGRHHVRLIFADAYRDELDGGLTWLGGGSGQLNTRRRCPSFGCAPRSLRQAFGQCLQLSREGGGAVG